MDCITNWLVISIHTIVVVQSNAWSRTICKKLTINSIYTCKKNLTFILKTKEYKVVMELNKYNDLEDTKKHLKSSCKQIKRD